MPGCCSVADCKNTRYTVADPKLHFYSFPNRPYEYEKKKIWIKFASRKSVDGKPWTPAKNAIICSAHFINNKRSMHPMNPSFHPTIHSSRKPPSSKANQQAVNRFKRSFQRNEKKKVFINAAIQAKTITINQWNEVGVQTESVAVYGGLSMWTCEQMMGNAGTQVNHNTVGHVGIQNSASVTSVAVGPDKRLCLFSGYLSIKDNDNSIFDLTAVSSQVFSDLLSLLPVGESVMNEITRENKLLIFLMKLKLGLTFAALGCLFGVHPTTASKWFHFVLSHLHSKTKNWIKWPTRDTVKQTLPSAFTKNYSDARVIIDCTEFKSDTPPGVDKQVSMYSKYKGTFTMKYLIGITPAGCISFLSSGYGGRETDSFVINDSGFLDLIEPGDVVFADKVSPQVVNDLSMKGAVLVMPPFTKQKNEQFTGKKYSETYKRRSVGIYVERAIQRIKTFLLLKKRLQADILSEMDKIVHVCAVLANLQSDSVKKK